MGSLSDRDEASSSMRLPVLLIVKYRNGYKQGELRLNYWDVSYIIVGVPFHPFLGKAASTLSSLE